MRVSLRCVCGESIEMDYLERTNKENEPTQIKAFKEKHKDCLRHYWEERDDYRAFSTKKEDSK